MRLRASRKALLLDAAVIIVLAAIAYLPRIHELSYFRDDWYYMADGLAGGPAVFREMFWIDRPARGYLFEFLFQTFGLNPLPYHITTFAWRVLSGLAALWLFRLIWPGNRRAALCAALLFVLFPGYVWWVSGIEYQPMILSALLQTVSIALSIQAIVAARGWARALLWSASIVTGWLYLLLVDYAIGMEVFRFLALYVAVRARDPMALQRKTIVRTLRTWLPASAIALAFLAWRFLVFESHREATDVGLQLGRLLDEPLRVGLSWATRLIQSVSNEVALAWAVPLSRRFFGLGSGEAIAGLMLGLLAIGVLAARGSLRLRVSETAEDSAGSPQPVAPPESHPGRLASIGLVGVVMGVAPIVMANRYYEFDAFSHYGLPASLAAALVLAAVLDSISIAPIRRALLAALVLCSVLTHYGVAAAASKEEDIIRRFWWQVAWRAPGISPGTTLLVSYPGIAYYGEDLDIVWAPANFLYGIEKTTAYPVAYRLSAVPVREDALLSILVGLNFGPVTYRTHRTFVDYGNILVVSQTQPNGCAHVMLGTPPRISSQESPGIALVAHRSNRNNNIQTDVEPEMPLFVVFGPEPKHDWCYFYQKAELALQRGDLQEVAELGSLAERTGLAPADSVEWMPFLQAYANLGDERRLADLNARLADDAFQRMQACRTLAAIIDQGLARPQDAASVARDEFCN